MMSRADEPVQRPRSRKPDVRAAMRGVIGRVRAEISFEVPEAQVCSGQCEGCSRKLLDYLDMELQEWERRLDDGEKPGLDDLSRLIRTSEKIYRVLARNGLVAPK